MCEPSHSIVQFPDDESGGGVSNRVGMALGKIAQWGKRFGRFFHISRMGAGHSEAMRLSGQSSWTLGDHANYETHWWERQVRPDGPLYYHDMDGNLISNCARDIVRPESLLAAERYANAVCLGSMSTFRRFLETSLKCTDNPGRYIERFESMLNHKGKEVLHARLRSLGFSLSHSKIYIRNVSAPVLKTIMGFTRRRELLVPEWADEPKLWLPGQ